MCPPAGETKVSAAQNARTVIARMRRLSARQNALTGIRCKDGPSVRIAERRSGSIHRCHRRWFRNRMIRQCIESCGSGCGAPRAGRWSSGSTRRCRRGWTGRGYGTMCVGNASLISRILKGELNGVFSSLMAAAKGRRKKIFRLPLDIF
jgi:hypothetical protein